MSSDINIILQLLQRQLSQVPPAYSPISPSSHNLAMYGILPRSLEPLAPCAPLEDEEPTTLEQVRPPFHPGRAAFLQMGLEKGVDLPGDASARRGFWGAACHLQHYQLAWGVGSSAQA